MASNCLKSSAAESGKTSPVRKVAIAAKIKFYGLVFESLFGGHRVECFQPLDHDFRPCSVSGYHGDFVQLFISLFSRSNWQNSAVL